MYIVLILFGTDVLHIVVWSAPQIIEISFFCTKLHVHYETTGSNLSVKYFSKICTSRQDIDRYIANEVNSICKIMVLCMIKTLNKNLAEWVSLHVGKGGCVLYKITTSR